MPDPELDVRPLPKPDKHPRIFELFGALAVGESFVLVNNHDPKHLRREFETEHPSGFGWDYLDLGPATWRIRISKLASTPIPRILCDAREVAAGPHDPDASGAVWKLEMSQRHLDSNIIRLPPGSRIEAHTGPDLDVLMLSSTVAGNWPPRPARLPCIPERSPGSRACPGARSRPASQA